MLAATLPVALFVFHTIPDLINQRRQKRLAEIGGDLLPKYFRLAPRDDQASYIRPDGVHKEILEWLEHPPSSLLYLTGKSGTGKTSMLSAFVIPHLVSEGARVIYVHGYQDPLADLEQQLMKSGGMAQDFSSEPKDIYSLLKRTCRDVPNRVIVVFDQFDEIFVAQSTEQQKGFAQFFAALSKNPIDNLVLLLVFRSDFMGRVEKLPLPRGVRNKNRKDIPPFTARAAEQFMRGSGLQFSDALLRDMMREMAKVEQNKLEVRPVTINLCGLVFDHSHKDLLLDFRHGGLIRNFLRESMQDPSVRDVAPRLLPFLIRKYPDKRVQTIDGLAKETSFDPEAVQNCLQELSSVDIVRPIDAEQQTWEISHDFLVPLLDSIVAPSPISLLKKGRPWLPWIAAAAMIVVAVKATSLEKDPIVKLRNLGWTPSDTNTGMPLTYAGPGSPPQESFAVMRLIKGSVEVTISQATDSSISELGAATNITKLTLSGKVSNLEPLSSLQELSMLNLANTQVSNLEPLRRLAKLSILDVSQTKDDSQTNSKVRSLDPLRTLTGLSNLQLSGTQVGDLEPLKGLSHLSKLNLSETRVSNLEPLRDLTNLSELQLSRTQVRDLEPLRGLSHLSKLNLSETKVSNLEPLRDLTNLSELQLSGTRVRDLDPLKGLSRLSKLNLNETEVSNLEPLKDLNRLSELQLSGTLVRNLEPLKGLERLSSLDVSSTTIEKAAVSDLQNANRYLTIYDGKPEEKEDKTPQKGISQNTPAVKNVEFSLAGYRWSPWQAISITTVLARIRTSSSPGEICTP